MLQENSSPVAESGCCAQSAPAGQTQSHASAPVQLCGVQATNGGGPPNTLVQTVPGRQLVPLHEMSAQGVVLVDQVPAQVATTTPTVAQRSYRQ